uniref:Uncharacterized protein n=1 Tax=Nicotiana tabacum TaxID=4097 RepID=A0A1S4D8K8_TOBAC|nr:PREDICTED: uncharacterized protein LOC107827175 [Nicotiana tabacum]
MELPWIIGGDLNVVLHEDQKIGGLPVHPPEYEDFSFGVKSFGLFDLGYKGSPFTWTGSDHAPLLMSCGEQSTYFIKPFKFLNFWTKHETFKEQNLKRVKIALSERSKETYGDIFKQHAITEYIVKVKEILFEEEPTAENRIVLQKAQAELKSYLSIEEPYWKQKAGMIWFTEGDRNTRFFHNHVKGKRQKLQLKRIQKGDGVWVESQDDMAVAVVEFYQRQFTKEADPTDFTLLENKPAMVTMEQNLELCRYPYS